jgi:hypothetical protein
MTNEGITGSLPASWSTLTALQSPEGCLYVILVSMGPLGDAARLAS